MKSQRSLCSSSLISISSMVYSDLVSQWSIVILCYYFSKTLQNSHFSYYFLFAMLRLEQEENKSHITFNCNSKIECRGEKCIQRFLFLSLILRLLLFSFVLEFNWKTKHRNIKFFGCRRPIRMYKTENKRTQCNFKIEYSCNVDCGILVSSVFFCTRK